MNRRTDLVAVIQALSRDEGARQPSADEWLADLDRRANAATSHPQSVVEHMPDLAPDSGKQGAP